MAQLNYGPISPRRVTLG